MYGKNDNNNSNDQVMWKFSFGSGKFPRALKVPLQKYRDVEEEECIWNFSKNKRELLTEMVPEEMRTSVMLRGIPSDYNRDDIVQLLLERGFGEINFFYLPMNLKSGLNTGYAFINFRFPQNASEFKSSFSGTPFSETRPEEIGWVHWRCPIQGFASHFDRYRRNFASHSGLPSQFKPMLYRNGKGVPFPAVWDGVKVCRKVQKYI